MLVRAGTTPPPALGGSLAWDRGALAPAGATVCKERHPSAATGSWRHPHQTFCRMGEPARQHLHFPGRGRWGVRGRSREGGLTCAETVPE